VANGSTPTSADACMSIVHSLSCHRQGGESEQFSKRAIESLVKKLKEKRNELDNLITAITTNGAHSTKCVTIPRTLDGRLQIAGRKCFPHVIYAKIWRWPDLHKNELRKAQDCQFSFDLKVDSVCVNPYHYIRDVSLGVDLAALTLHHQQQQQAALYQPEDNSRDWNHYNPPPPPAPTPGWNGYECGAYVPPVAPAVPHHTTTENYLQNEITYHQHTQPPSSWHHQVPRKFTLDCKANDQNNADHSSTPQCSERQLSSPWTSNTSPESVSTRRTSNETLLPDYDYVSSIRKNDNEPISRIEPPEHWCSIAYFELDAPVGETFKAPSPGCPIVQVDGYVEHSTPENLIKRRFCLGALTNLQGKEVCEITRQHIGRGVQLELKGEGDVWLECLSKYAVFVQSHYLDWMAKKQPGVVVHKISPTVRVKVFDLKECVRQMKDRILNSQNLGNANGGGVPNGGHLAPALSHATAASGFGIDDLRKFCTFHLSFVKGYGPDYKNRKTIVDTPCWIQVQLHRGLQVLDEILREVKGRQDAQQKHSPPEFEQPLSIETANQITVV